MPSADVPTEAVYGSSGMTNAPSPTDEDRELIEHDVAWLRERGYSTEKGGDEEIFYRIADRLESLLSDREQGAGGISGSREPSPSCTGLGPSGFDPGRVLEFRPDERGKFDEIVARFADGMVHVETMSKDGCYVGFYWDDGRYCQWWIHATKKGKLSYNHEDGDGPPPRFTAWGVDRTPSDLAIAMETRRAETGNTDSVAKP